jgi:hypothetical protein
MRFVNGLPGPPLDGTSRGDFRHRSTPPAPLARLLSACQHDPRTHPRLHRPLEQSLDRPRRCAPRSTPAGSRPPRGAHVVRRASVPLAGFSLPHASRHRWALVAGGKRLPFGSFRIPPNDLGPASPHTPRRVHKGCEPGAFHHRPRAPAASIRSCVFLPIQRLRPDVSISRGSRCLCYRKRAACLDGHSSALSSSGSSDPAQGRIASLTLPRPTAAPRWLLRP